MATIKTRKAYKAKGSRSLARDLGTIAAQLAVATLLGGMAGGLAAHTWRGAFIGTLSIASVALFLAPRATREGRYIGWGAGTAAGVSALALSFGARAPSSTPTTTATAGLGKLGCGCRAAAQLGAAPVYGHPLGLRGACGC